MKPAPFDYVSPATVEEACQLLGEAGGGATIIAGGQSLMPMLNLRMSQPFILVDLSRISSLLGIIRSGDGIRIGAMASQVDALADATLVRHLPVMVEALGHVGHHQTRNRGTIGGSIALGDPAAELPAVALALEATIEAASTRGTRSIPAREFYIGPYKTALEPDEVLTAVHFPEWPGGHVTLFREVVRRPGDFALVGIVGALALEGGRVSRVGLAWFGMGPTPIRASQAEKLLIGQPVGEIDPHAMAEAAIADTAPFDDQHASAQYRTIVGRRIFARALGEALGIREAA